MMLEKIISGGQTGVDRGALDAALEAGFPCGGWCPADRAAEDASIPSRYPVVPLPRGGAFGAGARGRMCWIATEPQSCIGTFSPAERY